MLKWITAISMLLLIGLCVLSYLTGVSLRTAGILEGRNVLRIASEDLAANGYVTNLSSSNYRVWLSTNVTTIGGTQYQCFAEIGGGKFRDDGTLAMTSNHIFIWLDRRRSPKIIGKDYTAPLFPPRF